jgi:glucose/mannose-6-phosphate isomerase
MPSHIEVTAQGQNKIEELLWLIMLGDFVGIYLACLNGVNPADIQLLERLKSELNNS